ncbi:hypothetical protein [Fimbriimonas ginsengisoli]|uniref:Capsule polysaccharide biosynthesis protein n=1 Tax=Fimbriimonas ginsengisoli Gsoil 348 TaxID=661478 RepID=A0A068NTH5_FIMGI|nr:hypothetical protein [Fimbriimonas ginsengisoli]AIE86642.1 Capsule polysaccharide biosynthesis protein [Fimbriimonas ginsengisoli Gsoil 348]
MSQVNVCFFSIWERTETWIATGKKLAENGVQVFHVVTPREYFDMCLANGVPKENILWLRIDDALAAPLDTESLDRIRHYEEITGISLKNYLMMDRFLRTRPWEEMIKYAAYCFRRIHDFLDKNDVRFCSGEPSDTHDLVAMLICRATGRHYGAPFDIRFPVNRFVLWDSEIEATPFITAAKTPNDVSPEMLELAAEARNKILNRQRMQHLAVKRKAPSIGLKFISRVTRGVIYRAAVRSKHDGHMYTVKSVLFDLKYHMIPINYRRNKLQWDRLFEKPVEGEKFVLYTLNYQPEHSIDVESPHWMNAYEVVKSISRMLPVDTRLYIKEHPSALGIRSPQYLKMMKRLPGVRLIDPYVDSHDLLTKAVLTVSLTGTICVEAAMYGKPAAIISDTFIGLFSTVRVLSHPREVADLLRKPPPVHDLDHDLRVMAWMLENAHEGTIVDRITNPIGTSEENIKLVSQGYMRVINAISDGRIQPRPLLDGTQPCPAS